MPGKSDDFLRRLRHALTDWAAWKAMNGIARAQQAGKDVLHGGRFHCAGCGKDFRGPRAMNAHHLAQHAGRWGGAKARAAGRKMGKETDKMRRHARGWLEAAGLRDAQGKATAKARSRPEVRGKVGWRDLRPLHRHDRDHERAERHHRRADQAAAKGNSARQADHHHRAAKLRNRWPERPRQPQPARPVPSEDRLSDLLNRAAQANGNGSRPAQARPARTREPTGRAGT